MNSTRLFGGALMAAGICVTASADFTGFTQNSGNYIGASFGGYSSFSINGFHDETETNGDAIAIAQSTPTSFTASGEVSSGTGLAYTIHFNPISFSVDADTMATVSWDFTGDIDNGAYIDSFVQVDGPGGNLVFADLNDPTGSVQISLVAGETYSIFGTALATQGASYFTMAIPSPGSVALLAMAGLVGRRRRRI